MKPMLDQQKLYYLISAAQEVVYIILSRSYSEDEYGSRRMQECA